MKTLITDRCFSGTVQCPEVRGLCRQQAGCVWTDDEQALISI